MNAPAGGKARCSSVVDRSADRPLGLLRQYRLDRDVTAQKLAAYARLSLRTLISLEGTAPQRPREATVTKIIRGFERSRHPLRPEEEETLRRLCASLPNRRDDSSRPVGSPPISTDGRGTHGRASSVPVPLTTLVDRQEQVQAITEWARSSEGRLLTLLGPGGSGKTRLALESARALAATFRDRVTFVALEAIRSASLLLPAIARTLGLPARGARSVREMLGEYLGEERHLLILDNLEHLGDAALPVADLLRRCPALKIVATSRSALRLSGEQLYPVRPFPIEDLDSRPSLERARQSVAVQLFVERARAVRPDFALDEQNAPAIAEICRQLDGLPLAIELASTRCRLLEPAEIVPRLEGRQRLMISGPRDAPFRQQTLWNTLSWSYELLNENERTLFRRLAVFVGGATLEAIEAVCSPIHGGVLELVTSLLDKSLLQRENVDLGQGRLRMLETVREFAFAKLQDAGEEDELRSRYRDWYVSLAIPPEIA